MQIENKNEVQEISGSEFWNNIQSACDALEAAVLTDPDEELMMQAAADIAEKLPEEFRALITMQFLGDIDAKPDIKSVASWAETFGSDWINSFRRFGKAMNLIDQI